jgi:hypothetical protein
VEPRTFLRIRKQLGIPFRGTKIEENLGIPFRTIPRKRTQLGIPFRATKNRNNLSDCRSEPFSGRETNSEPNAAAENFKNSFRKDSLGSLKKTKPTVIFQQPSSSLS